MKRILVSLTFFASFHCGAQADKSQYATCLSLIAQSDQSAVIQTKIPLANAKDVTFKMLTDESLPSASEKEAVAAWAEGRERCWNLLGTRQPVDHPGQNAIASEYYGAIQRLIADLFLGKLTFGAFNKRRVEIFDEFSRREDELLAKFAPVRTEADLRRDGAACDYEVNRTMAGATPIPYSAPGTGPLQRSFERLGSSMLSADQRQGLFDSCLRAKGWVQTSKGVWEPK